MLLYMTLLLTSVSNTVAYSNDVYMDGDAVLGGLFSIQNDNGGDCKEVVPSSVQTYEAVRWFLKELNKRNYIQNVTLGLHAFKTCSQAPRSVKATLDLLERWQNQSKLFGLIGPDRTSETQSVSRLFSSLPEESRLPQLVYSATAASLLDKTVYKNLYRVIAPDTIQVQIISQLLVKLRWNYIGIVYEVDTYGTEAAKELKEQAEKLDICVPFSEEVDSSVTETKLRDKIDSIGRKLEAETESTIIGLVFIGQAHTAESMFRYLKIGLDRFQIIVSESIRESLDYVKDSQGVYSRAKGLLTSSPPVYSKEKFQLHWELIHKNASVMREAISDNDWMLKYMNTQTGCDLNKQPVIPENCIDATFTADQDGLSVYLSYALMAAASFTKTLKDTHSVLCQPGDGICENMKSPEGHKRFLENMATTTVDPELEFPELSGISLKFSFRDGEIDYSDNKNFSEYIVSNLQQCSPGSDTFCYVKVGDFIGGQLFISGSIKSYNKDGAEKEGAEEAQCQPGFACSSCYPASTDGPILYIPGDYYVIGLVPIHDKGDNPYKCGKLRTAISVDIAEALAYVVTRANKKRLIFANLLGDKKVGLILMDTCNTPFLTRERVMKFLRGDLKINDSLYSSQLTDKVIGFVGPYSSSNSVPLSSLMTEVDKLYISYASTSSRLSDRSLFPNFMRTCSPDSKQADIIMNIASSLDSKYVQIIYTDEEYGKAGRESLKEAAKKYGVCIAQYLAIEEVTDKAKYQGIVSDLRKTKHARLVIIFVRSHVTPVLMKVLNEVIDKDEFTFIGGEAWGKRTAVLKNNDKLRGCLTVAQELPKNGGYEEYYGDIDLQTTKSPWLQDYLEMKYKCYYPMSFNKMKYDEQPAEECSANLVSQTTETDTWVPFIINAANALILGFNKTLATKCFGFNSICSDYSTADLIRNVKDVRLDIYSQGTKVRVFDDNGEGIVGYVISHVISDGEKLVYRKVATSENGLDFSLSDLDPAHRVKYSSACPNERKCEICEKQLGEKSPPGASESKSSSSAVVGLAVALAVMVLLVIVLIVMVCWCNKRNRPHKEPDYLTVVPDQTSHAYVTSPVHDNINKACMEAETQID